MTGRRLAARVTLLAWLDAVIGLDRLVDALKSVGAWPQDSR